MNQIKNLQIDNSNHKIELEEKQKLLKTANLKLEGHEERTKAL